NDPYEGGGTHGNDFTSLLPIFSNSQLIGFCAFRGHVLDAGGMHEGGYYNNATEVYQELFRVPPVRLYRKGEPDDDIVRILRTNSRLPDSLMGDLRSSVAAVRTGEKRVQFLINKYGHDKYKEYVKEILRQ